MVGTDVPEARWWQRRKGEVTGPYTLTELRKRVTMGALNTGDELCPEGTVAWDRAGTVPDLFARSMPAAAHGAWYGQRAAGGCFALLAAFVLVNYPGKFTDANFWMGSVCLGVFVVSAGYWVGHGMGSVIGKYADRTDVAQAVTVTATIGVCVLCLGMGAVFLWYSDSWRIDRFLAERKSAPVPPPVSPPASAPVSPPEPRYKGRTAREWVAVYQRREPQTFREAGDALTALGTTECVAAFVNELETGDSPNLEQQAIHSLADLALRGERATRTALPALRRIAAGLPRPSGSPPGPQPSPTISQSATRTIRLIEALK